MSGEPEATPTFSAVDAGPAVRPWTPEAAMEPVPPLAPPPRQARAGSRVATTVRAGSGGGPRTMATRLIVVAVLLGALILLLTVAGR